VLKIILILDEVFFLHTVPFLVEPQQDALSEQYAVVVLPETNVVNASVIHREYLPVRFYLQLQLGACEQADHVQKPMQPFLAAIQHHHVIHIPIIILDAKHFFNEVVKV
jgi:hypothetical protein